MRLALFALALASPVTARAEMRVISSLEWKICEADAVSWARVQKARGLEDTKPLQDAKWETETWTLKPMQTLKGKPGIRVIQWRSWSEESATAWMGKPYVFFLKRVDPPVEGKPEFHLENRTGDLLDPAAGRWASKDPVVTADGKLLKGEKAVLAAIKGIVRRIQAQGPCESERIELRSDTPAHAAVHGGSTVYLVVPRKKGPKEKSPSAPEKPQS